MPVLETHKKQAKQLWRTKVSFTIATSVRKTDAPAKLRTSEAVNALPVSSGTESV